MGTVLRPLIRRDKRPLIHPDPCALGCFSHDLVFIPKSISAKAVKDVADLRVITIHD